MFHQLLDPERIYSRLPIRFQNWVCSFYGWREAKKRFTPFFFEKLAWLDESQFWSKDEIKKYQDEQIRKIILHAYQFVPFYQRIFGERQLTPDDIGGIEDLSKLPILTKNDVRDKRDELVSEAFKNDSLISVHTSGTTGKSLTLFKEPQAVALQWAIWARHVQRFVHSFNDLYVSFSVRKAVPREQMKPPYWRYNRAFNQYIINMDHITPSKIHDIVGFLNSIRPQFYRAIPSILAEVARLAVEQNLRLDPQARPRVIVTGSEKLYRWQRESIENWVGAPVSDLYGFTEGAGNASQCENGVYHEDFEFGYFELENPEIQEDGGVLGTLIATAFSNYAMPLIRYRVGDIAVFPNEAGGQCKCGRNSRVIASFEGRNEDYLVTPEGYRTMRFDMIFKETDNVSEAQICQFKEGGLTIRIVPVSEFTEQDEAKVRDQVAYWISSKLEVDFEYVDAIEREPNGKFRAVKSFLN